ncbi:NAD(P)/FAD-dependent oxidoreductase [Pseudorhodoferax sp. Leaf267]|uniref:NAD(P)/FAD-dependent oxidoreductase n=1 Tax=Pseudorhodoferax sp. Leaf267 TaxID=1736316 RepID=UPI0006F36724|nr:NAD(P)/FAD-dependent oxidoreductase [Pseudorhodoferax sp. Leaf267]KQP11883.1 amine oxidase [Pseudorhodoferax sp. Leaf267]
MTFAHTTRVAIVGGGFAGLSVAYELAKAGVPVTVLEAEAELGGLAAAFEVEGEQLERFYHHWFTNDLAVMGLIEDLGLQSHVQINPTNTGVYYANRFFKLSTPLDLLRFEPLGLVDRIRLGLLALRARRVKDWRALEDKTAEQWLRELGGENVYRVVWEPLLNGKFGPVAKRISAVWFWNKLKLRGGSRGKGGEERLAYFSGGFVALVEALAARIRELGGRIETGAPVRQIRPGAAGGWVVECAGGTVQCEQVVATPALPLVADMVGSWASADYQAQLRRIEYLANTCLVLELDRPLSSTYWLNVNDPSFPFVGVIEHTNFAKAESYGGRHIVYLSKYLPHTEVLYAMSADALFAYATPHLKKMFPAFDPAWVLKHHVWKARWSQPVVEQHYSRLIPSEQGPRPGFWLCSMAQIYPEDRGTNYAVREGRRLGRQLAGQIGPVPGAAS